MCGICGIFEHRSQRPVEREQIQRMNDTLVHRGPDDDGIFVGPGVGIANRRLSIIDIAGSKQPIHNEDRTVWVVLNGEIYNFAVLRQHLVRRGHTLTTQGDTEVIVHLYEEYGDRCVEHLDGMFAFALYDGRDPHHPRLLVARDAIGKKPLYYADVEGALIFGSELKAVLKDPRVPREVDPEALHHYLTLLMVPAPWSIFRAVKKLMPGHLLVADARGVSTRPWWDYRSFVNDAPATEAELVSEVRQRLYDAVQKRLVAEVPLGAFLSGGMDSSAVVGVMSRLRAQPVKTFSIGFEGPATHNELPQAAAVARHLGTDHHEFLVKPDIVELLPELTHFLDEPFAISSAIPTYLISRAARQHVTVVLTGDGGDETFGGYENYLFERWARAWRLLPQGVDGLVSAAAGRLAGHIEHPLGRAASRAARFVSTARLGLAERRLGWVNGLTEDRKRALYASGFAASNANTAQMLAGRLEGLRHGLRSEQEVNALDNLVWLPDEMLTKVDRMTMAASVEARSPLLDRPMIESLAGFGLGVKIPGNTSRSLKSLLRKAIADILPPEKFSFRKWGFNVPMDRWFRTGAKGFLESHLGPDRLGRRGIFDPTAVAALNARHQRGEVNASSQLYALLVFEIWAEASL